MGPLGIQYASTARPPNLNGSPNPRATERRTLHIETLRSTAQDLAPKFQGSEDSHAYRLRTPFEFSSNSIDREILPAEELASLPSAPFQLRLCRGGGRASLGFLEGI